MPAELLEKYKSAILKRREAEAELNEQLQHQTAPDMKVKVRECKDTEEQLKQVETRLGKLVPLCLSVRLKQALLDPT